MPKFLDQPSWYASNGTQVYGVGTSNSTSHTNGAVPVWRQVAGYFDEIVPTVNGFPFTDIHSWYAPTTNPNGGQVLSSTGTGAPTWKETLSSVNGRAIQSSYGNTSIYAPVSGGTKGQVLASSGNGVAPGWGPKITVWRGLSTTIGNFITRNEAGVLFAWGNSGLAGMIKGTDPFDFCIIVKSELENNAYYITIDGTSVRRMSVATTSTVLSTQSASDIFVLSILTDDVIQQ